MIRSQSIQFTDTRIDSSTCYRADQTIKSLMNTQKETDRFLHPGDIAYADYFYLVNNGSFEAIRTISGDLKHLRNLKSLYLSNNQIGK